MEGPQGAEEQNRSVGFGGSESTDSLGLVFSRVDIVSMLAVGTEPVLDREAQPGTSWWLDNVWFCHLGHC